MIKNLSQLKKRLTKGAQFSILAHCRTDCVGQRREVTVSNTQGFYAGIQGQPTHRVSTANCGRGSWLAWSKPAFWEFNGTNVCSLYDSDTQHTPERLILSFEVTNDE